MKNLNWILLLILMPFFSSSQKVFDRWDIKIGLLNTVFNIDEPYRFEVKIIDHKHSFTLGGDLGKSFKKNFVIFTGFHYDLNIYKTEQDNFFMNPEVSGTITSKLFYNTFKIPFMLQYRLAPLKLKTTCLLLGLTGKYTALFQENTYVDLYFNGMGFSYQLTPPEFNHNFGLEIKGGISHVLEMNDNRQLSIGLFYNWSAVKSPHYRIERVINDNPQAYRAEFNPRLNTIELSLYYTILRTEKVKKKK